MNRETFFPKAYDICLFRAFVKEDAVAEAGRMVVYRERRMTEYPFTRVIAV